MDLLIWIVGFFAIMWFFLINPQRKKEKQRQELIRNLEIGDKVSTLGGIYGAIAGIKDRSFLLQIADGVVIEVAKHGIAHVRDDDDEEDARTDSDENDGDDNSDKE